MSRLFRMLGTTVAMVLVTLGAVGGTAAAGTTDSSGALALPTCTRTSWGIPATESGDADCLLGQGVSNPAVTELQYSLKECHGFSIATDGIYGPNTAAAVRSVQRSAGIAVDGVYGPSTRAAMLWRVNGCQF
ncbi:Putative peptidoglycan binding domain-containing protein [Actinopolyspora lacussalsi subsp. righensis]|uniref:Putative peptidoglycan binding domain-containing protein n=2 Tax=Actinopolyspora righensis TaxID=995060 RepID=A0A1I6X754_9ACTN|nr:Putative peptidoglycan binding domain-containing protein [Actinopolyspora righensis]